MTEVSLQLRWARQVRPQDTNSLHRPSARQSDPLVVSSLYSQVMFVNILHFIH